MCQRGGTPASNDILARTRAVIGRPARTAEPVCDIVVNQSTAKGPGGCFYFLCNDCVQFTRGGGACIVQLWVVFKQVGVVELNLNIQQQRSVTRRLRPALFESIVVKYQGKYICAPYMRARRHMFTVITSTSGPVDRVPTRRSMAVRQRRAL